MSPSGAGIMVECPVWYVVDRFAHLASSAEGETRGFGGLPVSGTEIALGPDAVRASVSVGEYTEERRPTSKFTRMR